MYKQIADSIPSLGHGGKEISNYLMEAARSLSTGNDIIEIGPWLGSATSYLALGLRYSDNYKSTIHCYDRWLADSVFSNKALTAHGINFELNENILPYFKKNISPFGINYKTYRGDFRKSEEYEGQSIGLVIDDICSGKPLTDHLFKNYSPYFISGATLIYMMDFYFYETHDLSCRLYQRDFTEANKKCLHFEGRINNSRTAVFRWIGGELNYLPEEPYNEYFKEII